MLSELIKQFCLLFVVQQKVELIFIKQRFLSAFSLRTRFIRSIQFLSKPIYSFCKLSYWKLGRLESNKIWYRDGGWFLATVYWLFAEMLKVWSVATLFIVLSEECTQNIFFLFHLLAFFDHFLTGVRTVLHRGKPKRWSTFRKVNVVPCYFILNFQYSCNVKMYKL